MKIVLIGGSGFIGTRLTRRLLKAGHQVKIIDIKESSSFPGLWEKGDVRAADTLSPHLKGADAVYNLAAEHRDDVTPHSLYYDVNVTGARNVCAAAAENNINKLIFISSVSVYGFAPKGTDESGTINPFNHYGKSKAQAESVCRSWLKGSAARSLSIIRPTVVFGEGNRGNVYNLFHQIAAGKFLMVGSGKNIKSMAYIENIAAFLEETLTFGTGEHLYNYVDKPDFDMNALVRKINGKMGRRQTVGFRVPYRFGLLAGISFDILSKLTGKKFPISAIRIRKFTQDTMFSSSRLDKLDFTAPVPLSEGIDLTLEHEFLRNK